MLKPISARLREALARANPAAKHAPTPDAMRVVALAGNTVDLLIYGDIGDAWWDEESVTAKSVVASLAALTPTTINVRINSYGGSVSDGVAIYNELRRQAAGGVAVNTFVDGVACSIASLIAVASDTVTMGANTLMMLHAPWGTLYIDGCAKDIREAAEEFAATLEVFGRAMAESYARKSGKPATEFTAMWESGRDYWYSAADAKAAGLCDVVVDESAATSDIPATADATAQLLSHVVARAPAELRANVRAALRAPASTNPPASASESQPAAAGDQPGAISMPDIKTPTADDIKAAAKAEQQRISAALRDRNAEIRAMAEPHMANAAIREYVDNVVAESDLDIVAGDVGKQILAILAKNRSPIAGNGEVVAGADERDKRKGAMANAIQARTGAAKPDAENPYRGHTLAELARECVVRAGVNVNGMDRMAIVATAFTHTSSDFPGLLGDTARTAVLRGYQTAEVDIGQIARPVSVSDFKPSSLAGLGQFSGLDIVPEGGEYKYGTFSQQSQAIKLVTYGKLFSVSRQAIINDQLSVLSEVPQKMGAAAKRAVIDAVFNLINSNPTLADGFALFSAQHANLLTASTISTTSVDAMRAAMALQKDPDGQIIRVPLKTLVTPIALGGLARTVMTSQTEVSGSKNLTTPNIVRDTFQVLDDGRLDAASATAWYGIADPALIDGLVIGYLDGNQEPYLGDSDKGFTVDGVAWKVRIDAAPAIADYRGLSKNPGA